MNINWLVRIKNKAWWLAMIPAVAILVQTCLNIFGISWDYTEWVGKILAIIEALFVVLTIMGINTDPTTQGLADSMRAMSYDTPAPNINEWKDVISEIPDDLKIGGTQ